MPLRRIHMIYRGGCHHGQVAEYSMWLFYVVNIKKYIHIKIIPEDLQNL